MPTKLAVRLYPTGASCSVRSDHQRVAPVRTESSGWSVSAIRRNTAFLMSVVPGSLSGVGYSCTFTLLDVPDTPEEYSKIRNSLFKRLRRMGCMRCHWVIEWTRKRRPHMHLAVWFSGEQIHVRRDLFRHWLEVSSDFRSSRKGQFIETIYNQTGWFQYVSKHASRGASHYQRDASARPANWIKSGRMWGRFGDWVTQSTDLEFDYQEGYFQFRRWVKKYRISIHSDQLRKLINTPDSDPKDVRIMKNRVNQAKTIFSVSQENATRDIEKKYGLVNYSIAEIKEAKNRISSLRGVSEWIDGSVTHMMLSELANQGLTCSIIDKSEATP